MYRQAIHSFVCNFSFHAIAIVRLPQGVCVLNYCHTCVFMWFQLPHYKIEIISWKCRAFNRNCSWRRVSLDTLNKTVLSFSFFLNRITREIKNDSGFHGWLLRVYYIYTCIHTDIKMCAFVSIHGEYGMCVTYIYIDIDYVKKVIQRLKQQKWTHSSINISRLRYAICNAWIFMYGN